MHQTDGGDESSNELSEVVDLTDNPISIVPSTCSSSIQNIYGFNPPMKINRKIPQQSRAADPSLCLDLIDDMYAIYNDQEVGDHFFQIISIDNFLNLITECLQKFAPRSYFNDQTEITPRMRTILVDWIVEVHYKYKLHPATLWLCINILDRYLEKNLIPRNRLQLVGITSLFIACKFEEIHAPEVKDCVYLTDSAYQRADILGMESDILNILNYDLLVPTPYHFLTRFLLRIRATDKLKFAAHYAAERNLQEAEILNYTPKTIAASAVYIAIRSAYIDGPENFECWTPALIEESGLQKPDFAECATIMLRHINEIPVASTRRKLDASRKKYATKTMYFVTDQPFPEEL